MITYADVPGVSVRVLGEAGLRVVIEPEVPRDEATRARVAQAWQEHVRTHPRDYDGAILDVREIDAEHGVVFVRRERYRHLAVGAPLGAPVRLLAVTGIVTGVDQDGDECVLLGRRSGATRIYGGLWELAPSGGVKCPVESVRELALGDVRRSLMEEGFEELGVNLGDAEFTPVAVVSDDQAASDDVLVRVRLREAINSKWLACRVQDAGAWEYVDTAWVPVHRLRGWVSGKTGAVIPPSMAVMRWLGWA